MKIFLLTHERELHRGTNTGSLALENSQNIVERILWERINPNKELMRLIENNEAVLLYSKGESIVEGDTSPAVIEEYENIIIIDSTWQEAKKMFNHSAYLKNAALFTLKTGNNSLYKLRANQPEGGLCTIECIIEVLKIKGQDKIASELLLKFDQFNG
ncbi:DTW domain-containing protein [Colwellia sp. 75C3]|uniref:tRNA-uridine aminocarboxypropyltransferase n=1 Tax=Colwellia sp. 75C3 TaxID=888425 RepID=UPI000C32E631|nr:tRNA-uridine aminocarboxypropyltransferase [Colwellia sp. 75C3]PKG83299.1 DTW domain-containing protein [Colwellia sp. 75C3]